MKIVTHLRVISIETLSPDTHPPSDSAFLSNHAWEEGGRGVKEISNPQEAPPRERKSNQRPQKPLNKPSLDHVSFPFVFPVWSSAEAEMELLFHQWGP